ncbi:MAG: hypothetical protein U0359_41640 [Byssovorax sp.]
MSDAVSEAEPKAKKAKASAVAAAAAKTEEKKSDELAGPKAAGEEHPSDRYETPMEYDPTAKVPVVIVLVWSCAIIGFISYMAVYLFPDLALWGNP